MEETAYLALSGIALITAGVMAFQNKKALAAASAVAAVVLIILAFAKVF